MKGNLIWIMIALAAFAVNIWLGFGLRASQPDGVMWMVHFGLAAAAIIFAILLIVFGRVQDKARAKLTALGLSESDIDALMKSDASEEEMVAKIQAASTRSSQSTKEQDP